MISVIIPTYNRAGTILRSVNSVLNQTYKDLELLIIDDGSTDNTKELLEQINDDRIRYIYLGANSGASNARNAGVSYASGEWIAFQDSDDAWKPEKLELQLKFMKSNNYCFTFTAYDVFKDSKDVRRKIFAVPQRINYKQFLKNSVIGCLTVVVDKERIQDFHMESGYLEDTLTWMHYLQKGIIAYGLNKNLASYRITKGSKSSNKIENAGRYYQCLKKQKGIGTISRIYYFMCYAYHAVKKRLFSKITTEI